MTTPYSSLANKLIEARERCTPLTAFPGELPTTPQAAYQVQDLCIAGFNDTLVGWKVAGLKPELHEAFQAPRQSGPVFKRNLQFSTGKDHILAPVFADSFAAIEAEFVIELADISSLPTSNLTIDDARNAIAKVYMGIEVASTPMKHTHSYGPLSPVCDFGNNAGVIIGPEIPNWRDINLSDIDVSVKIGDEMIGENNSKPGLAGPLGAVTYLLEHLAERGHTPSPGTYISSGAITGVHSAAIGVPSDVVFKGIGSISLEFIAAKPQD